MVYLGLERGATGWLAQTNPLSYGSTPVLILSLCCSRTKKVLDRVEFEPLIHTRPLLSVLWSIYKQATLMIRDPKIEPDFKLPMLFNWDPLPIFFIIFSPFRAIIAQ